MFNVFAMNPIEREFAIAEKAYEIGMAEVAYLEAMIDAKLKINMAKCEYKVMTEGCAESAQSDLVYLYNEAVKESESNSEGIFAKTKRIVVEFFISAWNTIQKLFTKEDTEAYKNLQDSKKKITLPMNIKFLAEKGGLIANELDKQEPSEKKFSGIAKIIGATVAVGGGIAGATALIKHMGEAATQKTEVTQSEAVSILQKLKDMFPKFKKSVDNINDNPSDNGGSTGILKIFKEMGSLITKAIQAIKSALKIDVNEDSSDTKPANSNDELKNVGNDDLE